MKYINYIQKSIDYIEDNLHDNLNLDVLATVAMCSKYHYHRIFKALVGYPVVQYIRYRKLAHAAYELLNTHKKIVNISMDFGYNSQAAFDRAFKKFSGISPSRYRSGKTPIILYEKVDLTGRVYVENKSYFFGPKIVEMRSLKLVGMVFSGTTKENIKNRTVKRFWDKFMLLQSKIKNKIDPFTGYGASFDSTLTDFNYLAAFEVSKFEDVPKGMVTKEISQSKYAVFTLTDEINIENYYKSLKYFFENWFYKSKYKFSSDVNLIEILSISKKDNKREIFDLYIPIKER